MKLTILMPCLNEAETLGSCIRKARGWVERCGIDAEIVVADNGSTDGSQDIARSLGARVVDVDKKGYGSALYYGSLAAAGEWIIMGDSDDSYDFNQLDAFIEKLGEGYDLVMGNRFRGGIAPAAMPWKNRYFGNPLLSGIGARLFGSGIGDWHCGLRGYTKQAFVRMDLRTSGMEYASEMVIKSYLMGLRMTEVPTTLSKDGRSRPPHLNPWRDGWRHLRFMLMFQPNWLFVLPGSVLASASLALYLRLLAGPLSLGPAVLDYHTLLFAEAGILLGALGLAFGLVLRMVGIREGLLQGNWLLAQLRRSSKVEIGGGIGLAMVALGVGNAVFALAHWGSKDFGPLQPEELLRAVSFSTLMLVLGGMVLLTAIVIGFLDLPTREQRLKDFGSD